MPAGERFKRLWGRVEKKLGIGDSPTGSTSSLPLAQPNLLPSSPLRARSHSPNPQPCAQDLPPRAEPHIETSGDSDQLTTSQDIYKEFNKPAGASDLMTQTSTSAKSESTPANSAWRCFNGFRRVLGGITDGVGPLKAIMDELEVIFSMYEDAAEAQSDYVALRAELEQIFSGLNAHFSGNVPPTMTAGMNNLCAAIEHELDRISKKEDRQIGRRYLEARMDLNDVMKCYRRIQGQLERLSLNADLSMWKIVDEHACESRLKSLTPSMSACYNSAESLQVGRRECTPETRKQVLDSLSRWRHDRSQENMYWLNGMAGTGKTTIASSLCAMLDRSHELGASFFCTRLLPECRNVKLILPTIAYQLARFSRPFYHALSAALQSDPDLHTKTLPIQLQGLIIDPLRKATKALPLDLVVVIDALDECDDSQAVGLLLEVIAKNASALPLKVFVSSRPEPQIREKIGAAKAKLILHELEESIVKGDIKLYFQTEFEELSTFITDAELATLVERAGVLFIYAATVVRYIKMVSSSSRRQYRVREVLDVDNSESPRTDSDIDALYSAILTSAFTSPEVNEKERKTMKLVLDTVVCAQEPLTVSALAGLCGMKNQAVQAALEPLWSVLHISGGDSLVTTLHASFPDYMLDSARSSQLGCQSEQHHGRLAELCFNRIDTNECQFNICGLESSYVFDEQVPDLRDRVRVSIPADLWYACRYWATHLKYGGPSAEGLKKLENLLENRLLLWMEVLNLKQQMSVGATIIETAESWCKETEHTSDLKDLVRDAWRLVTVFATNDVSRSTPHLYVSMLASWPAAGSLTRCYQHQMRGLTKVEGTAMARRQLASLGALNAGDGVCSVGFSPNGTQIASGIENGTIELWDALNGKPLLDPLEGHTDWVRSIAFTSDGTSIVSGSDDRTIRVWDIQTGKPLLDPIEGHADWVRSVAFSPDGTRIVSGSHDQTVRLWDAQTGRSLLEPLKGHTGYVMSVAFSPDGTRIVSGSYDKTIRVWDAPTGKQLLDPLQGHTDYVRSVAFSPENMRVVSASDDGTIRLWDAQTGKQLLGSLEGHSDSVNSVAFSPDGTRIVSGSDDRTIRVWDACTGEPLRDPLKGHIELVTSVSFSFDGTRIVSGSRDKTIRVWDTQTSMLPLDLLKGHNQRVTSLAFSLDGQSVVSGSADQSIQVWDAQTGESLLELLKGHTKSVTSVSFSPDGALIVSGSEDAAIRVWEAQTGKLLLDPLQGHADQVNSVAFSPDGMRIASGAYDNTVILWDAQTGKPLLEPLKGHTDWVRSVAFSPDSTRIVSGSDDMTLRVWDAHTGKPLLQPLQGHTSYIMSVSFSANGMRIASGSYDKTIRTWDTKTGKQMLGPLEGHTSSVLSVTFSPDGTRIISSSYDSTIRVWDVQTGQLLFKLKGHADWLGLVAFSPDGRRAVSGSADAAIRVWNIEGLALPSQFNMEVSDRISPSWQLGEKGWAVDKQQRPLLWLPPDLRDRVVLPQMVCLMATEGSITLDFSKAKLGESWSECYAPRI